MKNRPFLLILFVGTALVAVGLTLGLSLGDQKTQPETFDIIYTKPIISEPKPVEPKPEKKASSTKKDAANL